MEIQNENTKTASSQENVVESFNLKLDHKLTKALNSEHDEIIIAGGQSSLGLAALLARHETPIHNLRPHVVVFSTFEECLHFKQQMLFFDPINKIEVLTEFDVDPYSGLYPKTSNMSSRVGWCFKASNAKKGQVFVASIQGLLQRTLPKEVLNEQSHIFAPQMELPNNIHGFLQNLGYANAPVVEDVGTYSLRGGILDVFSPAHKQPIRIELFGDLIDSIRQFDPHTQRSLHNLEEFYIVPAREIIFSEDNKQSALIEFNKSKAGRNVDPEESRNIYHSITQGNYFQGIDFLLPYFYKNLCTPLEHFNLPINVWFVDSLNMARTYDDYIAELKNNYDESSHSCVHPNYSDLYLKFDEIKLSSHSKKVILDKIHVEDSPHKEKVIIPWSQNSLKEVQTSFSSKLKDPQEIASEIEKRFSAWKMQHSCIFISTLTHSSAQRIAHLIDRAGYKPVLADEKEFLWSHWISEQQQNDKLVHIVLRPCFETLKLQEENILFMRAEDFFGHKRGRKTYKDTGTLEQRTHALSFGDLKSEDLVVHKLHGVGIFKGLKVMAIQGVDSEFIELEYKGKDRLYLPVYRIGQVQKYSGPLSSKLIDKLGGTGWQKTQTKVRSQLKDIASELLKLYALRSQLKKQPFSPPDDDYEGFTVSFPYEETEDQLRAIDDVIGDMTSTKPMDRLVCGDVGFGKTEVALRAAFKAIEDGKQVAIIAPTTVLTFQHLQTFLKRFKDWPVRIEALNRLVSKANQKKVVQKIKSGDVDIAIGTHRLFSKDIDFKNLGLLVIDEEQKFGVKHKEKIRKLKQSVDTLAMSATPIPRTLNLSLMGIRDLSIINTPPIDRLPTRTFVCKFDKETIRKAVDAEVARGGQIFFIHNRVQSIYALHDELKAFLPNVRMAVAHGQMDESGLEKVMLQFFNHEIDMLICTTIVESGMDIPKANTMFIDNAQQLGLSQLYQLRGRVGRSKTRAYCYLIVPRNKKLDDVAQERLKVIQEHTALGSGIQIAQYDLELRGAGDMLGEDQSGNINAVGYELYLELLEQEVAQLKGEELKEDLEPEINLKIPALIPDQYIPDIRIRLAYYKAMSSVQDANDLDRIEEELHDQFGTPPEPVLNLLGVMLIRKYCKDLSIKDITAGKIGISLVLTDKTKLPIEKVLHLTQRQDNKYSISPDNRISLRMREITWPRVLEELSFLKTLMPS